MQMRSHEIMQECLRALPVLWQHTADFPMDSGINPSLALCRIAVGKDSEELEELSSQVEEVIREASDKGYGLDADVWASCLDAAKQGPKPLLLELRELLREHAGHEGGE